MEELLRRILDELVTLRQGQDETRVDIQDLKEGQQELRQGYDQMRADIRDLKEGQQELRQGHEELWKGYEQMRADIQDLKEGQARLEERMTRLEVRIESEVIDKIRGLYDAREIILDKLDRIEGKLAVHDELLNRHSHQILTLRLRLNRKLRR